MSKKDYMRERCRIERQIGKDFLVTVASNSIKLSFNISNHRTRYLWIDPVWYMLDSDGNMVIDSRSSPVESSVFWLWASGADAIRGARLSSLSYVDGVGTVFCMDNGCRVIAADSNDTLDEDDVMDDYDDFYWAE